MYGKKFGVKKGVLDEYPLRAGLETAATSVERNSYWGSGGRGALERRLGAKMDASA
jgi:hypothetical protein